MSNKIGYGALLLGIAPVVGGCFYRTAAVDPGGPYPGIIVEQRAIRIANIVMVGGGIVTVVGAVFAYVISRFNRPRQPDNQKPP